MILWKIESREDHCSVPRCREKTAIEYMGLWICDKCWGKECDHPFLYRYAGPYSRMYLQQRYTRINKMVMERTGMILRKGDRVKWSSDAVKPLKLKANSGVVENLLPKGFLHVDEVKSKCRIEDVAIVWIKVDDGARIGLLPEKIYPEYAEEGEEIEQDIVSRLWE